VARSKLISTSEFPNSQVKQADKMQADAKRTANVFGDVLRRGILVNPKACRVKFV